MYVQLEGDNKELAVSETVEPEVGLRVEGGQGPGGVAGEGGAGVDGVCLQSRKCSHWHSASPWLR